VTKVNLLIILAVAVGLVVFALRHDGRLRADGAMAFVRAIAIAISLAAAGVLLAVRAGMLPDSTLVPPFVAWALMTRYPDRFQRVLELARRALTPPER
jgi:multisubunit Na+/H+ antiporter MnhB subunit